MLCGGPVGQRGSCHVVTGRWSDCTDNVCSTLDEAGIEKPQGTLIARARIRHGRFAMHVKPGEYEVVLLWTSRHRAATATDRRRVRVQGDRTTRLLFKAYAG